MRREFSLPEFDVDYLESTNLQWETISGAGGARWLLIQDWPVRHKGYNVNRVAVALQIPPGYPDAQIDMAYFHPHLTRTDGKAIGAISTLDIDEKSYQRWSRHRTTAAPWRAGEDDISTHMVLVDDWLERELAKP